MNCKNVSRDIKPAALWAIGQGGRKTFIAVPPLLQNNAELFIKDVGLESIVKKGNRAITGSSKKRQLGFSNLS